VARQQAPADAPSTKAERLPPSPAPRRDPFVAIRPFAAQWNEYKAAQTEGDKFFDFDDFGKRRRLLAAAGPVGCEGFFAAICGAQRYHWAEEVFPDV
jgi:hypothetical protein